MTKSFAIAFKNVKKSFILDKNFSLRYRLSIFNNHIDEKLSVINNISFEIKRNETVGLFGPNGSGKTTILRLISGILRPDSGKIHIYGKLASVIELGSGLHPELSGIDNIFLYAAILGVPKQHINGYLKKIIDFSGLSRFINLPLKKYSSGMKSRLAFSVAVFSDADILLFDEVFAVGDIQFRDKGMALLNKIKRSKTILFTSHDLRLMQQVCDRVLILDKGVLMNNRNKNIISFLKLMPEKQKFVAEAKSNSMYPTIKKGDLITLAKVDYNHINTGDIIAFSLSGMPEIIVHRVVNVIFNRRRKFFITKGDNAFGLDSWKINQSNYLGKVTMVEAGPHRIEEYI